MPEKTPADIIRFRRDVVENLLTLRREALEKALGPAKDINFECGYPETITIQEYKEMFEREGLATRVVDIWPKESWVTIPEVYETENPENTDFEKAWEILVDQQSLYAKLMRADVLSGIGRYGVLLIGIDDGKSLDKPIDGIDPKTGEGISKKDHKILYLKAFDESALSIPVIEEDPASPRYGLPISYSVNMQDYAGSVVSGSSISSKQITVHWTRILHLADNRTASDILGEPRMKPVYNRILDVRKVLGGSAEMFWKGGMFGLAFTTTPGITMTEEDKEATKDMFEDWSNGLQRWMAFDGGEIKTLAPQVADPTGHVELQIKVIAMTLGIPYRILLGTEEAKLASGQDKSAWDSRVYSRCEKYITPMLLRPFIDRLIQIAVLPTPDQYFVDWPSRTIFTAQEKAAVAMSRAQALAVYANSMGNEIISARQFLINFMDFSPAEADAAIEEAKQEAMENEDELDTESSEDEEPGIINPETPQLPPGTELIDGVPTDTWTDDDEDADKEYQQPQLIEHGDRDSGHHGHKSESRKGVGQGGSDPKSGKTVREMRGEGGGGGGKIEYKDKEEEQRLKIREYTKVDGPAGSPWQPPPPPTGKGHGGAGKSAYDGLDNVSMGKMVEYAVLKNLPFTDLKPPGKQQNPMDVRYKKSQWAYEIKGFSIARQEYKISLRNKKGGKGAERDYAIKVEYCNKYGFTGGTIAGVLEYKGGKWQAYLYRKRDIGSFRLPLKKNSRGWTYMGLFPTKRFYSQKEIEAGAIQE